MRNNTINTNIVRLLLVLACVLAQCSPVLARAADLNATNPRCEYLANPVGIDFQKLRLSWQLDSKQRGQAQTAYQILVSSSKEKLKANIGDKWDSGKIRSGETTNVTYAGAALKSGEICHWKVRSWDKNGKIGQYSAPACFEMGLLKASDWKGLWIGADQSINTPLLRKTVSLPNKAIAKARAYICGLGFYELRINGRKVGDRVLDPNWTDYDDRKMTRLSYPFDDQTRKRVLYATYDVTKQLQSNSINALGVILGCGMFNNVAFKQEGDLWYGSPRMILQVNITYKDGTKESIVSNSDWKASGGPIVESYLRHGEIYDARLEKDGWDTAQYSDAAWQQANITNTPRGKLISQLSPPDKIVRTIIPKNMTAAADGSFVFDIGENITGWVNLKNVTGPSGGKIEIKYGEEVGSDGTFGTAQSGANFGNNTYLLKGTGNESHEPRFTYHGFRYFQVYYSYPCKPSLKDFQIAVVHTAVDKSVGSFECSNDLLNWIHDAYRRVQLNNMHSGVPTDCPTREKLGYTGDGQLTCESAMYNFDVAQFYTKWVNDMGDAQNMNPESKSYGYVPHTAPFYGGGGGPPWGSACITVPWTMYVHYGDKRMLQQHYDMMKRWMNYLATRADGNIINREEAGGWCLGDWCRPVKLYGNPWPIENPTGETTSVKYEDAYGKLFVCGYVIPDAVVINYCYARNAKLMTEIAQVLGKQSDAKYYADLYKTIAAAYNKTFLETTNPGQFSTGCAGADAYPLELGIVSGETSKRLLDHLIYNLFDPTRMDGHFDTGIVGTIVTLDVLRRFGHADKAFDLLTQTTYPSFGYWRSLGATTLWENWEEKLGTHGHAMYGSVDAFMFKHIAGISTDQSAPGFKKIIIKPSVRGSLSYAKASVRTVKGKIAIEWHQLKDGAFTMDVTIPANATADIYIPSNPASKCVNITEAGGGHSRIVWGKRGYSAGTPGIVGAKTVKDGTGDYIKISVGSGSYSLKAAA